MKTMFPREFVEWKDKFVPYIYWEEKHYNVLDRDRNRYELMTLDEAYQYWRLEIEPKTKEDGKE